MSLNPKLDAGVYAIRNTTDGKQYVGSAAKSFNKRWGTHRSNLRNQKHCNKKLQHAWNKYGESAFEFRILEVTKPEHAVAQEQVFLDWLKTFDGRFGYNICEVAGSILGVRRSDETKAKITVANRGKKHSANTLKKIGDASRSRKHSDESRKKTSAAMQGKTRSETHQSRLSAALRGKSRSDDVRKKMSAIQRARYLRNRLAREAISGQRHLFE